MESGLVVLLATMALTLGLLISLLTATLAEAEALTLGLVMEEVLRVLPLRPIQSLLRSTSPMSTWQREL